MVGQGKLTKNFHIREFKTKDGTLVPDKYIGNVKKLAENLQIIRDAIGDYPLFINSAYRHEAYNKKIGGSPKSQHLEAKAADIRSEKISVKNLHALILKLIKDGKIHNGGVGLYDTFVHYDVRITPGRW